MKPECVARRETFKEMNSENEYLRVQLRAVEGKLAASRNRVALTEKSVELAESRNETLRAQIEEAQSKIQSIESVVEKSEIRNQALRQQLSQSLKEIEDYKAQSDNYKRQTEMILENDCGPQVVFQSSSRVSTSDSFEVSALHSNISDSDSD